MGTKNGNCDRNFFVVKYCNCYIPSTGSVMCGTIFKKNRKFLVLLKNVHSKRQMECQKSIYRRSGMKLKPSIRVLCFIP